ncbi:hypothetical protein LGR54_03140 [Ancylobacter sp. Lp-2]|uniref:hypothetical protein n=1 Tax=Ancylobacter sp. Lp-2 TaxID=2881339 RepID=UPI001E52287E|nr:hypothetical protein [Ancylobacter sp. Lp-2]MCB4767590.1 hypothetical protein [Ancylobacter sp. Lp-2]
MPSGSLMPVHALWIGPELGPMARACLASFLRMGHAVTLHGYQRPHDLPAGIAFADAAKLVPPERIIRHRETGSYALFANVFRYRLLQRVDCLYVDCDVYCLKPVERADYLFAWEDDVHINGAVLRLPKDSPLLRRLNDVAADPTPIPPWLPEELQAELRENARQGRPTSVQDMPWGVLGPRAITWLAKDCSVDGKALPPESFYPMHYNHVHRLLDPELTVEDLVTPNSQCLHLYHELLHRLDLSAVPPSSPLGRILAEPMPPPPPAPPPGRWERLRGFLWRS